MSRVVSVKLTNAEYDSLEMLKRYTGLNTNQALKKLVTGELKHAR